MAQWLDSDTLVNSAGEVVYQRKSAGRGASQTLDFSGLVPRSVITGDVLSTGTTWIGFTTAGACGIKLLLENQCATGEFATLRLRARSANTTASGNGGNSVGTTTCADLSASANADDYGVLKARSGPSPNVS